MSITVCHAHQASRHQQQAEKILFVQFFHFDLILVVCVLFLIDNFCIRREVFPYNSITKAHLALRLHVVDGLEEKSRLVRLVLYSLSFFQVLARQCQIQGAHSLSQLCTADTRHNHHQLDRANQPRLPTSHPNECGQAAQ